MRLVSFIKKNNEHDLRWGFWLPEQGYVLDAKLADAQLPASLRETIEIVDSEKLKNIYQDATHDKFLNARVALDNVALKAPYTNPPRNILCTGINYAEHLDELTRPLAVEQKLPEFPFIFTKPCTAITDPNCGLDCHARVTDSYDYEVELAVIIGKSGRNIEKDNALDHVFGYSIINDLSARNLQRRTSQWYCGKALDDSAPFGPCIVHKDSIANVQDLNIICRINGEVRQSSNTKNMLFDVPTLIHILSQDMTLLAGDIIITGTPSGVGMSFNPPKYLKSGDTMDLEIEHIGILHNYII